MKKLFKIIIIILVIVLLVSVAVTAVKNKKEKETKIPPAKEYAVVVHTIIPKMQNTTLTLPYIALVQDDKSTTLSSKFSSRIEEIKHSGVKVKKGETLIKLDTAVLKANLKSIDTEIEAAKAALESKKENLQNLKAIHKRTKELLEVKGASLERFENEKSKISSALASLKSSFAKIKSLKAKKEEIINLLSYANITAPIDGIIAKTFVTKGDMAMPGKPLMQISSFDGTYLLVRVPRDIEPKAVFYKNKKLHITDLSHTFNGLKEYRTDTINSTLTAGEKVVADLVTYEGKGLKLPMDALLNKDGKTYILTAKGNRARAKEVKIIASGKEGVVIEQNIAQKERVIVEKPDILLKLLSGIKIVTLKK